MPLSKPVGSAHPFKQEIIRMVRGYDASRPRSLQKHLGPSEIGAGCDRQLAYKLGHTPEVNETADPWFPVIGTAVHAWLGDAAMWYNTHLGRDKNPRFLIENRVKIQSRASGYDTAGHTDLYDVDNCRVIDWKIVGTTTMRKVIKDGTSQQYRVQGNTYGEGWVQAGFEVKEILICYLPRSNFLDKMILDSLPFEPELAHQALQRVGTIETLVNAGMAPESFPAGDCTIWCPFYRPHVELGRTSCPGHGSVKDD
jgi:hypothetical protein